MNVSDRRAFAMCEAALEKLRAEPERVRTQALANVAVWERARTCHPSYAARWRRLLDLPVDELAATLLTDTDEGQALRANNPFAGLFDRAERNRILAAGQVA